MDPFEPTRAYPGSPEKIHILTLRAILGIPLFLPGDQRPPRGTDHRGLIPEVHQHSGGKAAVQGRTVGLVTQVYAGSFTLTRWG